MNDFANGCFGLIKTINFDKPFRFIRPTAFDQLKRCVNLRLKSRDSKLILYVQLHIHNQLVCMQKEIRNLLDRKLIQIQNLCPLCPARLIHQDFRRRFLHFHHRQILTNLHISFGLAFFYLDF